MSLLERERAAVVVVDVQEGFRSYETFDASRPPAAGSSRARGSSASR